MKMKKKTTKTRGKPNERKAAAQIRKQAVGRWLEILPDLAPQLKPAIEKVGDHVACPVHGGKDGFRFFQNAEETGGGICNTCGSFPDGLKVLRWANDWSGQQAVDAVLGWLSENPHQHPAQFPQNDRRRNEAAKRSLEKIEAEVMTDSGRVAEYFGHRGLGGEVPAVLYFHPNLDYYKDGKKFAKFPAMIASFQRVDGLVVGYLRLYLDPDGPGKADVTPAKKKYSSDVERCITWGLDSTGTRCRDNGDRGRSRNCSGCYPSNRNAGLGSRVGGRNGSSGVPGRGGHGLYLGR